MLSVTKAIRYFASQAGAEGRTVSLWSRVFFSSFGFFYLLYPRQLCSLCTSNRNQHGRKRNTQNHVVVSDVDVDAIAVDEDDDIDKDGGGGVNADGADVDDDGVVDNDDIVDYDQAVSPAIEDNLPAVQLARR